MESAELARDIFFNRLRKREFGRLDKLRHVYLDFTGGNIHPQSLLDLSVISPDFVSLSFYKIFGYPTGIGCLLVKRSTFNKLQKPWFAGGTITLSAIRYKNDIIPDRVFLQPGHR